MLILLLGRGYRRLLCTILGEGMAASLMTILASLLLSHGMRGGFRLQVPGECGVSCLYQPRYCSIL